MIVIEDKTIHISRGDAPTGEYNKLAFCVPIYKGEDTTPEYYEFQLTDKITFVVFEKKGYTKKEIFRIDYTIAELGYLKPTTVAEIPLTEELTSKFPLKNKKYTYWYDISINDTLTVLGSDYDGAKKFIVYPAEGSEK